MIPFIHRNPNHSETTLLKLLISTFGDGSGQERDEFGTRAGWRDLERVIADVTDGEALERKHVFDVLISGLEDDSIIYGISVKSKCLGSNSKIDKLDKNGRVYMELTNSPAKLWGPLKLKGITEEHYGNEDYANEIGKSILSTVHSWYENSRNDGVDVDNSVHLTISYGRPKKVKVSKSQQTTISYGDPKGVVSSRNYQIHVFNLSFPDGIVWTFVTENCLRGFDPNYPDAVLFDWYGLSGGQLKYYPKASESKFKSEVFEILIPKEVSLRKKAEDYWPDEWNKIKDHLTEKT